MAITGPDLAARVFADYVAAIPSAVNANRNNAETGIATHNVPFELVSAISKGFVTSLLLMTVKDSFSGTPGSSAPTPVPPVFNPGRIENAKKTFLSSMSWKGTSAGTFTDIMISSFFQNVAATTQIKMNTLVGAGPGLGLVIPSINVGLGDLMTSECNKNIMAEITSSGFFNQDDDPTKAPTQQISLLATHLSIAYGTIVGGTTASITYVGTSSATSALSAVNSGKFI